jgi:hypothetical protein
MPPQEQNKSSKNVLTIIVVVVILIAVAYLMMGNTAQKPATNSNQPSTNNSQVTKEAITYKAVDLSSGSKLPQGFPSSIPVESKTIVAADTKVYTDRTPNVVLQTVNYNSSKTVLEKYNEYLDYMTKNGYSFGTNGKDSKNHTLYGMNGTNSLLVVVSSSGGQTLVQLAYTTVK